MYFRSKAILSFWKDALIEADLITSFAVLKITGVGEKLWDFVKNGFDKTVESMGGFENMLTMDLEAIMELELLWKWLPPLERE